MPTATVELPDGREVEFPEGTDPAVMQAALQRDFPTYFAPVVGKVALTADNRALNDHAATAGGPPAALADAATTDEALGGILPPVANRNNAGFWEGINTPMVDLLPTLSPESQQAIREQGSTKDKIVAGTWQGVAGLANYFTSPLGIATLGMGALPRAAQKIVSLAFAAQMTKHTPELARQLGAATAGPMETWDPQTVAQLTTEAAGTTAFTAMAGKHGLTPAKAEVISALVREMKQPVERPAGEIRFGQPSEPVPVDPAVTTGNSAPPPAPPVPAGAEPSALPSPPRSGRGQGEVSSSIPQPEPLATLDAQVAATLEPANPKAVTLVTPGAEMPKAEGLTRIETKQGVALVNAAKVDPELAKTELDAGRGGQLLGMSTAVKPVGPVPSPGADPRRVGAPGLQVAQTRTKEGTPIQEEVVTPATAADAIAAGKAVAPQGTTEIVSPENVLAERASRRVEENPPFKAGDQVDHQGVNKTIKRMSPDGQFAVIGNRAIPVRELKPFSPEVTKQHLKEAAEILDAQERGPDVLDEVIDNFKGVKIPDTADYAWARARIKALGQSKAAGLSKSTLKTLFAGPEPVDNVVTALNEAKPGGTPRYENTDALLKAMLDAAETRIAGRDVNRPEVRQLAEQIAIAEAAPKEKLVSTWDEAAAAVAAEMSGSTMNASKGGLNTAFPVLNASLAHDVRPMETPEILRLVRDIGGDPVAVKKLHAGLRGYMKGTGITLSEQLFADPKQVAMVLAHELGHVNDFLPEGTLKRGNLIGRLIGATHRFMLGQDGWVKDKKLRQELIALSAYWRPWDRTTAKDSYRKYRDSAKELYADAISVLLNSPGLLEKQAPHFYKAFFDRLDAKPLFKEEFFALQDLLARGPEAVLDARIGQSREAFEKGEAILHEKIALKEAARNSFKDFLTKVRIQSLDIADFVRRRLGSKDPRNPSEFDRLYEEWKMDDNRNALDISRIYHDMIVPITKTGLDEHSFGQMLELQRIVGGIDAYNNMQAMRTALGPKMDVLKVASDELFKLERSGMDPADAAAKVAAPLTAAGIPFDYIDIYRHLHESQGTRAELANDQGRSPAMAEAELNRLMEGFTPEQRTALSEAGAKFRALIFERATEARDVGIINQLTYDHTIVPNQHSYAAFRPLDKIDTFVSPMVRRAKGSLSEIENPFITTLLKLTSLNNLIETQKLKNSVRDSMTAMFPGDFTKAETRWSGRGMEAVPAKPGVGRVMILENGRRVEYDTDPYIAKMFEKLAPADNFWLNKLIGVPFRLGIYPLIIKYNPGFLFAMNPRRDMARTVRNLYAVEGVTRRELLPNYADPEVLTAVNDYLNGRPNKLAKAMIKNKAIGGSWQGFSHIDQETVMTDLLRRYKLADEPQKNAMMRGLLWLPNKVNEAGSFLEALPKFASYKTLIDRGVAPERASYLVRNYAGTPNFTIKGEWASIQNSYVPFINIFTQGWRADLKLATSPKTAGGFWFQWALQHGWQSVVVGLAVAGVFGDDIKRKFAGISEYDRTNYGVLPLGSQQTGEFALQGGKTVYLRFPRDETSRFFSALTYKLTRATADKLLGNPAHPQALPTEAFAFGAGVVPSPSPLLEVASAWKTYLAGQNPQDAFRNRPVISQKNFAAGGTAGAGDMFTWTLNQVGALSLVSYNKNADTTTEAVIGAAPVINRLVKVSDQGRREEQMNSERLDAQAKAKLRIQYNDDVQSLLAQHAWLQSLGAEKRTPAQETRYGDLHDWHSKEYIREDAAAWDERDQAAAQRKIVDAINRAATELKRRIDKQGANPLAAPAKDLKPGA